MDTNEMPDDIAKFLPPLARCICGRPLRLAYNRRFKRMAIVPRCECGTITEISDDELAEYIVCALMGYYCDIEHDFVE